MLNARLEGLNRAEEEHAWRMTGCRTLKEQVLADQTPKRVRTQKSEREHRTYLEVPSPVHDKLMRNGHRCDSRALSRQKGSLPEFGLDAVHDKPEKLNRR